MVRLLILIVAYNAEKHISSVISRIPDALWHSDIYETEILLLDDASQDNTALAGCLYSLKEGKVIRVARNEVNQGYGGNQKLGYIYAMAHNFDVVALLHGDGQYAPEILMDLVAPVASNDADAVFGSRMIYKKEALKGGMPLYKFCGNIILSTIQNSLMSYKLSEYHSGYRVYSINALRQLPFRYNSDWFDFDTDIIVQLIDNQMRIKELPIPTYYGDEICYVNGIRYAVRILWSTVLSRLQKYGLYYCRKYDYTPTEYTDKTFFDSSHTFIIEQLLPARKAIKVMDIGGGNGYVASRLKQLGMVVHGCDMLPTSEGQYDRYLQVDLNKAAFSEIEEEYDYVILGDVIEHLDAPEQFLENIRKVQGFSKATFLITTPNIAFILMRLLLLLGNFHYTAKGIMDRTHKRLFTFSSVTQLLEESGFVIEKTVGIPAPFPLMIKNRLLQKCCIHINIGLIKIWKSLFAYQIGIVAVPAVTLESKIHDAIQQGKILWSKAQLTQNCQLFEK